MNEITRKQAEQIHDLESYKEVTGARRFKRTNEEMQLGLSPEQALQRRLDQTLGRGHESITNGDTPPRGVSHEQTEPRAARPSTSRKGDILIRIRPQAGVDNDYFEHLDGQEVEVVLDEKFYAWLDTLTGMPYEGNKRRLWTHLLNLGIGEVLTKFHFPEDLEEFDSPVNHPETV